MCCVFWYLMRAFMVPRFATVASDDLELNRLTGELESLRGSHERLGADMDSLRRSYESVRVQLDATEALLQEERAELTYWIDRCKQLEDELYDNSMLQQSTDCWSHHTSPGREFDSE